MANERTAKGWRKTMDIYTWGIFICSVAIALFTVIKQANQSQKDTERLQNQIEQKDEIIAEFKNLITGGDSFFFIRPTKVSNTDDILFLVEYRGKYPVYDSTIAVEIFDYRADSTGALSYIKTGLQRYDLGTVQPLKQELLFQIKAPELEQTFGKRFFLKMSSRNLLIEEDIYIHKIGGEFKIAYKVVTHSPDYDNTMGIGFKDIKRRVRSIDENFPLWELSHYSGDSGWNPNDYIEQKGLTLPETQPIPPAQGT